MATWTRIAHSSAATWTKYIVSGITQYLLTPDSNFILVGSASDEFMVFSDVTTWTGLTKS